MFKHVIRYFRTCAFFFINKKLHASSGFDVEKKEKKKKERKKEIGLPSTQGIVEVMSSSVDCSGPFPHEFWREFFALSSYNAKS
jgi:hypothetical protein